MTVNPLVRGALAGAIGTGTMTIILAGAKRIGVLHPIPPEEITGRLEERGRIPVPRIGPVFTLRWLAAHLGFGVVGGAFYALSRPNLPESPVKAGLLYGFAIWAFAYIAFMPALGLYPGPLKDGRSRQAAMIVAHAVFGTTLAEIERRLAGREGPTERTYSTHALP